MREKDIGGKPSATCDQGAILKSILPFAVFLMGTKGKISSAKKIAENQKEILSYMIICRKDAVAVQGRTGCGAEDAKVQRKARKINEKESLRLCGSASEINKLEVH